jgi:hypothetical protein
MSVNSVKGYLDDETSDSRSNLLCQLLSTFSQLILPLDQWMIRLQTSYLPSSFTVVQGVAAN